MDDRHWTERELIEHAYGIGNGDSTHLEVCPECRSKWQGMTVQRAAVSADPEVSPLFLASQRRAIYRRLEERRSHAALYAPALAATAMMLVGFFLLRPTPTTPSPAPTDDTVFAEVYDLEQSSEPLAALPVRALFEEN